MKSEPLRRLGIFSLLLCFIMTGPVYGEPSSIDGRASSPSSESSGLSSGDISPEPGNSSSAGSSVRRPLEGRVEVLERDGPPTLPADFLNGSASSGEVLPADLAGKWYGSVRVVQMQVYPELHGQDPYWQQFISEIRRFVHPEQTGQVLLNFQRDQRGNLALASSDVILRGGTRLELSGGRGPALIPGGYNIPRTTMNRITQLDSGVVEQTRLDRVSIVDELSRPIRRGFTEISASYQLKSKRKMLIKLLDIDYDQNGAPLWKVLLEGEARR